MREWIATSERLPVREAKYTCRIVNDGKTTERYLRWVRWRDGTGDWIYTPNNHDLLPGDVVTHWKGKK